MYSLEAEVQQPYKMGGDWLAHLLQQGGTRVELHPTTEVSTKARHLDLA